MVRLVVDNSLVDMVELVPVLDEGTDRIELKAELRFATHTLKIDETRYLCGIRRAVLTLDLEGAEVVFGSTQFEPPPPTAERTVNMSNIRDTSYGVGVSIEATGWKALLPRLWGEASWRRKRSKAEADDVRSKYMAVRALPNRKWEVCSPDGSPITFSALQGDRLCDISLLDRANRASIEICLIVPKSEITIQTMSTSISMNRLKVLGCIANKSISEDLEELRNCGDEVLIVSKANYIFDETE